MCVRPVGAVTAVRRATAAPATPALQIPTHQWSRDVCLSDILTPHNTHLNTQGLCSPSAPDLDGQSPKHVALVALLDTRLHWGLCPDSP